MFVAALDLGTGGLHIELYSPDGIVLSSAYQELQYQTGSLAGTLEFDPESLFRVSMQCLSEVIRKGAVGKNEKMTIAVTGQRHGSVFLDADYRPVLSVVNLDGRVDKHFLSRMQRDNENIYATTGRAAGEIFPAVRMAWMCTHQPDVYRRIHSFAMISEWLCFRLTGILRGERTNSLESLLMDIHIGQWSEELLSLFGLSHLDLPELVDPGSCVSTILPDVASTYGIPGDTIVSLSAADTQCAVIGSEATEDGDVVVVNGSTTPVVMVTNVLHSDPQQTTWSDLHVDDTFLIESNGGRTGIVYRETTRLLACQALPEAVPEEIFNVHKMKMTAHFLPDPTGHVTFHDVPQSVWFQGELTDLLTYLPYLILENNAFSIAAKILELVRVRGSGVKRIYLTGGSSRSVLTQTILSSLHHNQEVFLTPTFDTTTRGAALLAWRTCATNYQGAIPDAPGKLDHQELSLHRNYRPDDFSDVVHERFHQWRHSFVAGSGKKDDD